MRSRPLAQPEGQLMNKDEVIRRIEDLVRGADGESLPDLSASEMAGGLMEVLVCYADDLPEPATSQLILVAARLMKTHCDAVEKDLLEARRIFNRR
jgi:hypothetical protein